MLPPTPDEILCDPASSFLLKYVLRSALQRDPVDAAADAALLAAVLQRHLDDILQQTKVKH